MKIEVMWPFFFLRSILTLLIISIIASSCKKETSCENCRSVNDLGQANRPPVANAGPDLTITLPTNTVNLDGSASTDPDNNIASYAWSKISGPSSFSFINANAAQTQVTNLVAGDYKVELKVTDAGGLIEKDTMQVSVKQEANTSLVDIYVAGDENGLPVYWKNGQAIALDNEYYSGTSIAIAGSDVCVAGTRNELVWNDNAAKYWKNGQGVQLGNYSGATSIATAGSDVYVAGWEWEPTGSGAVTVAKYWKNGQAVPLTNGTVEAYASSIAIVGSDIYVAGQEGDKAKYWKNGQAVSLSNGTNQAFANSIAVAGSGVYVAGSEENGSNHVAKYWKNGRAIPLTNGNIHARATSIAVAGSDVYVAGWEGGFYGMVGGSTSVAKYWKNGQEVSLTDGTTYAYTGAIAVFEGDVYVAGYEIVGGHYEAKYWKNGHAVRLTNGSNDGSASSIAVVKR